MFALIDSMTVIDFPSDEIVIRRLVRAIQKAIEEDVPEFCRENHMETMNSLRYVRGDKINENIRNLVVSDDIMLIPFRRYSWDGRMLVDQKNRSSYTVTTKQNLAAIPKKKDRKCPHFLQSILAVENVDLQGQCVQQTLFMMEEFEQDALEDDYMKIVEGILTLDSGYHHYVVTYEFERSNLLEVKLILLDKGFNVVSELDVSDFIKSDFGSLTAEHQDITEHMTDVSKSVRSLVAIKSGIRPNLIELEEENQV